MVGPDLKENRVWRDFGERLWQGGLPLPRIYAGDEARGLFLLEDLGDWRLDGLFASPAFASQKETLRPLLYAQAARILARWHRLAPKLLGDSPFFSHNPPYDRKFVLEAEWGYFLRGLKLLGLAVDWPALASEGDLLTQIPAKPPTVIHRDFQSRNLMVPRPCPNGGLWVLDWQGARPGPAVYDLASLIYDPYADLTEEETNLIVSEYLKERAEPGLRESLALVAPLRLAQAIGAYCHLSARGLPYGPYLAPALSRLAAALAKRSSRAGFPKLKALIAQAQERAAGLFSGPAERPCPSLEPPKPPKEAP
jgi:aminoglycoside/choline kinase family phosphotransferase